MVVGALAVLKAGGAYVPLDPTYASKRLSDILADSETTIVLADKAGRVAIGEGSLSLLTVIDPNTSLNVVNGFDRSNKDNDSNPQVPGLVSRHLAYVIYTSGSTGTPKGVLIEHQGVVNFIMTRPGICGIRQGSRVLQFASFGFDGSVMDVFATLGYGGTLYLLPNHIRYNPPLLWDYLRDHSITQALLPPALLRDCIDLPPLNNPLTMIVGGESYPASLLRALQSLFPNGTILNEYGPTETTIIAASWRFQEDFSGDIPPIGRPLANRRFYILDKHQNLVPLGAAGEIYIGGVGVARGYLNRPELTSEVFVHDPFAGAADARMYKTGDLGRYLPDGNICVLGRNDHQVKIRGFRIELGEIEARLTDHILVDKAIVVAMDQGNHKRLVAYVAAEQDDHLVNTLRSHLASCLPDYMVPAAIVRMDSLPLTSNGKIDRKALPAPDSDAFARQDYEEPQGVIENRIAQIWSELLHIDRVSRNDNFFALGGHSLLAVQMIERMRLVDLSLPIRVLFKTPTLSVLAQSISQYHEQEIPSNLITRETVTITPDMLPFIDLTQGDIDLIVKRVPGGVSNVQDIYSLSPLQEGILFHHLLESQGDPYLIITFTAFKSRELLDRYLEAIQQVVNRHDILRTAFMWDNLSTPAQVVWRQASLSVEEPQFDLANGPVKDQLMKHLDPRHHRIDLTQAPLVRFAIVRESDGRWVLAELLHHLIGDHSTLECMNLEIRAFMEGRGNTLPTPPPYRNLIFQVRSSKSQEDHEKFFTEMLADIDTPSLPFGLADVHGHGGEVTTSCRELPQELNDRLRRQAKQMG
ncbi:hypothetical protein BGZ65_008620, partial [Modicella reniformis]